MSLKSNELTTSELAVLETLGSMPHAVSQRELAKRTGLSLGLINAVIKRLVQTGYVKTSHLNRRSLEYLLTTQGFAHTALRSYRFIANTVRNYRSMQDKLKSIFENLTAQGFTEFYLHGSGELADLVSVFYAGEKKAELRRAIPEGDGSNAVVFNVAPEGFAGKAARVVDLIRELGFASNHAPTSEGA